MPRTFAKCDVPPDTLDERDAAYATRLSTAPRQCSIAAFRKAKVPVLDQGKNRVSAAFAAATAANYLLRSRGVSSDQHSVSPWMIHELARRFDDVRGRHSAQVGLRSVLKAWRAFGVCELSLWPGPSKVRMPTVTERQALDAAENRLSAYFRVDCRDIAAMQSALSEVGVLVASANIHGGWLQPSAKSGSIERGGAPIGGHAFVIIGYDSRGVWIQNSWGKSWGRDGCAHISYDGWLSSAMDVWAPQLCAPVRPPDTQGASILSGVAKKNALASSVRPYVISIGSGGGLNGAGIFGNVAADIEQCFRTTIPRAIHSSGVRTILLFCGGWLVGVSEYAQWIPQKISEALANDVYPLVIVWESGAGALLNEVLKDAGTRAIALPSNDASATASERRKDRTFEAEIAANSGGFLWELAKDEGDSSSNEVSGGMRLVAGHLAHLVQTMPNVEISIAAAGAGSLLLAPFTSLIAAGSRTQGSTRGTRQSLGLQVSHSLLYEPACPMPMFLRSFCDALQHGGIEKITLYAVRSEPSSFSGTAGAIGPKLLDVVARALEPEIENTATKREAPVAGLERHVLENERLRGFIKDGRLELVVSKEIGSEGRQPELWGADAIRDAFAFDAALGVHSKRKLDGCFT